MYKKVKGKFEIARFASLRLLEAFFGFIRSRVVPMRERDLSRALS